MDTNLIVTDETFPSTTNETHLEGSPAEIQSGFILIGVSHFLFVVVPCLILGPLLLWALVSDFKKIKTPVTIIFIDITLLCTIAPSTYGLLMDISLIGDVPAIGSCSNASRHVFWILVTIAYFTLLFDIALLSVIQYVIIHSVGNYKRYIMKLTIILLFVLHALTFLVGPLNFLIDDTSVDVRGSLCEYQGNGDQLVLIQSVIYIFIFVIPAISIVVIFSGLSYRFVKRNTIENSEAVKWVLKVMIAIILTTILFRVPQVTIFLYVFLFDRIEVGIYRQLIDFSPQYCSELNYPLSLVLIIAIHKTARGSLLGKLKQMRKLFMNFKDSSQSQ